MSEYKPRLLFKNPVFQSGVNATVRLGTKWFANAPPESIVEVWETNGGYLFDAFIVNSYNVKICDIDMDLLEHEHDPGCRTPQGLLAELKRVYGEDKVTSRSSVTVLLFEQCEADPGEWDDPTEPPKVH